MRLVKGSHIIVPKFWEGQQAYLVQNHDKRVIFINPYEGDKALIGTTDIPYDGAPEKVAADEREIEYLIAAVNRYFKGEAAAQRRDPRLLRVRPLFDDGKGNPSRRHPRLRVRSRRDRRRARSSTSSAARSRRSASSRSMRCTPREDVPADGRRLDGRARCCPAARFRVPYFPSFV